MALIPSSRYPAQTDSAAGYPHGKARNAGSYQDSTGTPLERDWVNDLWGFLQALLSNASITPSGDPDEVGASQYLEAVHFAARQDLEEFAISNWTDLGDLLSGSGWSGLAWSDDLELFVAVAAAGALYTAPPNAAAWTSRTSGLAALAGVGAGGTGVGFVAVGESGGLIHSDDGITWTVEDADTAANLWGVGFFSGLFIVLGTDVITTSPDGENWTAQAVSGELRAVTHNGSLAVAVGVSGAVYTSPDGTTWTSRTSGVVTSLLGVAWQGGRFVAVGTGGTIITSPDGITWTSRTSGVAVTLGSVVATPGHLLAIGASNTLLLSRDAGSTWQPVEHDVPTFSSGPGNWNGRRVVVVSSAGNVSRSLAPLAL